MCGITGMIHLEQDLRQQEALLRKMQETLRRRGPDQEGIFLSPRCAMAHTRLAVIDVEKGRQPMEITAGGETYTIVYNGELYNTPELRTQLEQEGVEKADACEAFCNLLGGGERTLLAAYNAQFDLNFLYHFLRPFGRADVLRAPRFLDVLTVYRDRRDYPHKLNDAITAYGLEDQAVNSHRAVDDARAAAVLLEAMAAERDDLDRYVDLFGYSPKYGVSGRRIASVEYRPQPYQRVRPLYEVTETL